MKKKDHPSKVLFSAGKKPLVSLPVCEHYAGSEKFIRKAFALQQEMGPVFDLTADCEDGAESGQELAHAQMLAEIIHNDATELSRVGVRIHDLESDFWQAELQLFLRIAGPNLCYLTVPKIRDLAQAEKFIEHFRGQCLEFDLAAPIPLHFIIETISALRQVREIAQLDPVEVLDFGLMDYIAEFSGAISDAAMLSPGQFEHQIILAAKTSIAEAALAEGKIPSHNPTFDYTSVDQCFADASLAREMFGFQRMWSIHPQQIKPIIDALSPSFSEIDAAAEILLQAEAANWGPISHRGRLHDRASYRYYWNLLVRAKNCGLSLNQECLKWFFSD